ncbi:MAG: 16S rRNA (cytosine(967)-C(5))-methyltransferase RsmB [Lachnospiraceae bacterium]|nr:16S rRNA (cytosine(967)-C(5))-methyltransferase RsmB [Lachnospiraceae bacterium]MDD3617127.1 16S rRNA (cytosine(967)-C(5))-methyltransferase RsmB [Lachnospiraceae bacterium]
MTSTVNPREIVLDILLEVNRDGEYSHIAIRRALDKYQFLPKQDRAFITRVTEGTIENMIQIDYIIDQFSSVKVSKMKPVIQNILRSGVYQIKDMNSIPNSAVCNEAVKLAQKRGFYSLKGFVNGVLRTIDRKLDAISIPNREDNPNLYLSVLYSMPMWIIEKWNAQFGTETTEKIIRDLLEDKPTCVRVKQYRTNQEFVLGTLKAQGVSIKPSPYLDYAFYISNYNYLPALEAFIQGNIQPQDVSSMLVAEIANPKKGDYIIDLCAAPGGKSLHVADKMQGFGTVDARDLTEYKVSMIQENIKRADIINIRPSVKDATIFDEMSVEKADIVLADVPCSGLGVIGKKTDIKYKITQDKQDELVILQRKILHNAASYVKPGGVLIYSTCTIGREENQDNIEWFTDNYSFELESLDPYLCEDLRSETTARGYLQLLPGIHGTDGFFLARLRRK